MSQIINGEGDLYALADGTLITWERINGDSTSMAIAFVHSDVDPDSPDADPVLWISPGGWQPVSPDQAGIRYPAVALGTLAELTGDSPYDRDRTEWRKTMDRYTDCVDLEPQTLMSGGTYLRETALECAARSVAGRPGVTTEGVLGVADAFLKWLTPAELPQPGADQTAGAVRAAVNEMAAEIRKAILDTDQSASAALQRVTNLLDLWTT